MPKDSYAEKVNDLELMASGIEHHQAELSDKGLDQPYADDLKLVKNQSVTLNNEQETLKAHLKDKTDQLNLKLSEGKKKYSFARKLVKLYIPQKLWKEFGIEDEK